MELLTKLFMPVGLGGLGVGSNPFTSGQSGSAADGGLSYDDIINKYSYKPQYTGQTEQGLYNLFNQTTGQGGGGVGAIPFDIGLPTTGLFDSQARGIMQSYLGSGNFTGNGLDWQSSGPQGGRLADIYAQANQMGIPEYGLNQARLGNQDLNNSLLDTAANLNNETKNRLTNVLGLGANIGSNLYSQDLAQQRFNTGIAAQGQQFDSGLSQAIQSANASSLSQLLSGAGALATTAFTGNPAAGAAAGQGINYLTGSNTAPATVSGLGSFSSNYGVSPGYNESLNYNSASKLIK